MTEPNYVYLVRYVEALGLRSDAKVLDFGCVNGALVKLLRERNVHCYGVDVFYGGASFEAVRTSELLRDDIIRAFPANSSLPFPDRSFDLVLSNHVFEHVVELEPPVREIRRVLRDDGLAYHHFPSREVLRDGHIGIPLSHRLPRGRRRFWYTLALRRLGLRYNKGTLSPREWTIRQLAWIDEFTAYRPSSEVHTVFGRYFDESHREITYCRFRAAPSRLVRSLLSIDLLTGFCEKAFRRLGFMALEMMKGPADPNRST